MTLVKTYEINSFEIIKSTLKIILKDLNNYQIIFSQTLDVKIVKTSVIEFTQMKHVDDKNNL